MLFKQDEHTHITTCTQLCSMYTTGELCVRVSYTVEGLVKLVRRMTSGRCWVDIGRRGLSCSSTAVHRKCHASQRLLDIILRRSFTRPSTALAVIEALETRLLTADFTSLRMSVSVECKRSACYATLIVPTVNFATLQIVWRKHAEC